MSRLLSWLKRSEKKEEPFLARKMKMKQSLFKCLDCERKSKKECVPYLFHRIARGKHCPGCGGSNIQKISISAVMELRWNKSVKRQLQILQAEKK